MLIEKIAQEHGLEIYIPENGKSGFGKNKQIPELNGVFSKTAVFWTQVPLGCNNDKNISCAQLAPELLEKSPLLSRMVKKDKLTISLTVNSEEFSDKYSYIGLSFGSSVIGFEVVSLNSPDVPIRRVILMTFDDKGQVQKEDISNNLLEMKLFDEVVGLTTTINKESWKNTELVCFAGSS